MQTETTKDTPIGRISRQVRNGLDNGAEWVARRKRPLDVVTDKTLKLNGISHEGAARLVRQQADFIEGTFEGTARRLRTAADANSFRSLVDGQVKLVPETRDRFVDEIRKTFEIFGDVRNELGQLVRETLNDLRGEYTMADKLEDAADDAADAVANAAEDISDHVEEATTH